MLESFHVFPEGHDSGPSFVSKGLSLFRHIPLCLACNGPVFLNGFCFERAERDGLSRQPARVM